jgi:hypothetical protein
LIERHIQLTLGTRCAMNVAAARVVNFDVCTSTVELSGFKVKSTPRERGCARPRTPMNAAQPANPRDIAG